MFILISSCKGKAFFRILQIFWNKMSLFVYFLLYYVRVFIIFIYLCRLNWGISQYLQLKLLTEI